MFFSFNIYHKDWLNYSVGTDQTGELCYNFSISNDLSQMINFPTWIPDCDSHSPALLNLFISSDTSVFCTMAIPSLGNSHHVFVSVSTDFPSYSQRDAPFHRIAYNYSRADWDGLPDHLEMFQRRIPLNSVLLLLLVNFVSGFWLELMYIFINVRIRSSLTHLQGFQLLVRLP